MATESSSLDLQQTAELNSTTKDKTEENCSSWLNRLRSRVDGNDIRVFIWIPVLVTLNLLWRVLVCILQILWFLLRELLLWSCTKVAEQWEQFRRDNWNPHNSSGVFIKKEERIQTGLSLGITAVESINNTNSATACDAFPLVIMNRDDIQEPLEQMAENENSAALDRSTEGVTKSENPKDETDNADVIKNICKPLELLSFVDKTEVVESNEDDVNEDALHGTGTKELKEELEVNYSAEPDLEESLTSPDVSEIAEEYGVSASPSPHENDDTKLDIVIVPGNGETNNGLFEVKNLAEELDGNNVLTQNLPACSQDVYLRTRTKPLTFKKCHDKEIFHLDPAEIRSIVASTSNSVKLSESTDKILLQLPPVVAAGGSGRGRLSRTNKSFQIRKVKSCYKPHSRTKKKRSVYQELKALAESIKDCEFEKYSDDENTETYELDVMSRDHVKPNIFKPFAAKNSDFADGISEAVGDNSLCYSLPGPVSSEKKNDPGLMNMKLAEDVWEAEGCKGTSSPHLDPPPGFEPHAYNTNNSKSIPDTKNETSASGMEKKLTEHLDNAILGYLLQHDSSLKREDLVGLVGRKIEKVPDWDVLNMIIGLK